MHFKPRMSSSRHITFVAPPLNLPPIVELPSTSNQTKESSESKSIKTFPKLPMYGPLNIRNYDEFLKEQKAIFYELYNQSCAKLYDISDYIYLFILDRGDFSRLLVTRRNSEHYAFKIYIKPLLVENKLVEKVFEEKRILQSLNCPFCIRLEYIHQNTSELIFILPFVSGGEIFTHLQRSSKFDERMSKFYAAQVVLALEYLHHCEVVYRELTPENLLLDHLGYLKLTKFNSSKRVTTRTYTFCGTPEYVAPEMIAGKGYGKSVDWWALGVLLFEMNVGHPPFISHDVLKTYENITAAQYTVPPNISRDLQDLLSRLLQPDVSKRAGNMKRGPEDVKNHKWFKGVNWLNMANRKVDPPFIPGKYKSSLNYPALAKSSMYESEPLSDNVDEYFKDF